MPRDVILGPDGLIYNMGKRAVIIDVSTTEPSISREAAAGITV